MTDRDSKLAKLFEEIAALLRAPDSAAANGHAAPEKRKPSRPKKTNGDDGANGHVFRPDMVRFGDHANIPFDDIKSKDLKALKPFLYGQLIDPARAKWRKHNQAQIDALDAVLMRRGDF